MKFKFGLSPDARFKRRQEKRKAREAWHKWYAWRPVPLIQAADKQTWAWLEWVERRHWVNVAPPDYRALEGKQNAHD